jgi:Domain of unknown function (DUF4190)
VPPPQYTPPPYQQPPGTPSSQYTPPGYAPAGAYGGVMAPPNDGQATTALVLGILSVVCCVILGPVAIFIGNASRRRIQASGGTLGGNGLATAGFVLGIIGTVFLVIGVVWVIVAVISAASSSALH